MTDSYGRIKINDDLTLTDLKNNQPIHLFKWTGTDTSGKRWSRTQAGTLSGLRFMCSINAWRGTLWAVYHDGTRSKLKSVYN